MPLIVHLDSAEDTEISKNNFNTEVTGTAKGTVSRGGRGDCQTETVFSSERPCAPLWSMLFPDVDPYGTIAGAGATGTSFQLMIELNTMLNSPWFCQR